IVASPNASTNDNTLFGVSCQSPMSCVAVGQYEAASGIQTLVVSPNGPNWAVVSSPSPGTEGNYLASISCTSTKTFCMAAGGYWDVGGVDRTLFEVRP